MGPTTHQSGAKSTGAWISHSSVSGPVSVSKEKRVDSEARGVAVKLGGQENRAVPAEGQTGGCTDTFPRSRSSWAPIGPLGPTSRAPHLVFPLRRSIPRRPPPSPLIQPPGEPSLHW